MLSEDTGQAPGQLVLCTAVPYEAAGPRGKVGGGWLLSQLDTAAGLAGQRFSEGDALIVAIDNLSFRGAIEPGNEFRIWCEVTRLGRTSFGLHMVAKARRAAETWDVLSADLSLVAVDERGVPRVIDKKSFSDIG